jgi:hypothetical protein
VGAPNSMAIHGERDLAAVRGVGERIAFLRSILETSTEYSIAANAIDRTIRPLEVGAPRLYGVSEGVQRAAAVVFDLTSDLRCAAVFRAASPPAFLRESRRTRRAIHRHLRSRSQIRTGLTQRDRSRC